MRLKIILGFLAIATMLSGCGSIKERQARISAAYAAADMATCKSFGFKVDQPEFTQCIVSEQRYRQTQMAIGHAQNLARQAALNAP